jgi:hypothetical protein
MQNKDKRSIVLSMLLGDGNLHVNSRGYGLFGIDHGIKQADYQAWKASLLSKALDRDVKCRVGHKGESVQISVCMKRFRSWYKFTYPNGKKDIAKILPFILHPELALAIWLMDDGYVEPSFSKLADGSKKNYGARFRIFTCDQSPETHEYIAKWFVDNFNTTIKIKYTTRKKDGKTYPFIKFSQEDSLKMWKIIREHVLQFKSMQYKFRYIEQLYQSRCLQPQAV